MKPNNTASGFRKQGCKKIVTVGWRFGHRNKWRQQGQDIHVRHQQYTINQLYTSNSECLSAPSATTTRVTCPPLVQN